MYTRKNPPFQPILRTSTDKTLLMILLDYYDYPHYWVASQCGISPPNLTRYARNYMKMSAKSATRLSSFFRIHAQDLQKVYNPEEQKQILQQLSKLPKTHQQTISFKEQEQNAS